MKLHHHRHDDLLYGVVVAALVAFALASFLDRLPVPGPPAALAATATTVTAVHTASSLTPTLQPLPSTEGERH
jgi:hypothetical protein